MIAHPSRVQQPDPTASTITRLARLDRGPRILLGDHLVIYPLGLIPYTALVCLLTACTYLLTWDVVMLTSGEAAHLAWWPFAWWAPAFFVATVAHESAHAWFYHHGEALDPTAPRDVARVILGAQPRTLGPELTPPWRLATVLAGPTAAALVGLTIASLATTTPGLATGVMISATALLNLLPVGPSDGAAALCAIRSMRAGD